MIARTKVILILLLLFTAGCAQDDVGQEQATAAGAGPQPAAVMPTATATATAQPSATPTTAPSATPTEPATSTPQPTPTPTEAPELLLYTADGNPCQRPIYPGPMLGGAGQQPVALAGRNTTDETSAVIARLPHHGISFAAFAGGDSDRVVTHNNRSDNGEEIILWDLDSGEQGAQFQDEQGYYGLAVSSDAPRLAALGSQGLWLLDLEQPSVAGPERVAEIPHARRVALTADGRLAAVSTAHYTEEGNWDTVLIIEAETGRELVHLQGEMVEPSAGEEDDPYAPKEMRNGHAAPINWLGFTPNGQALLTVSAIDDTMRLWDVRSGEHLRCFDLDAVGYFRSAAFSPDGQEIATITGRELLIWDTATSAIDRRFDLPRVLHLGDGTAVYNPDGQTIISYFEDQENAYLWDSQTGRLTGLLHHTDPVVHAQANADGRLIVTSVRQDKGPYPDAAWIWDAQHDQVARAAGVTLLLVDAFERGEAGDIEGMLLSFAEARSLAPAGSGLLRPADWHRLCLYGIKNDAAAAVLEVCDTAVALVADQEMDLETQVILVRVRDSRGVARALSGDFAGALEDFQYVVANAVDPLEYLDDPYSYEADWAQESYERSLQQHQEWIGELENGRNPLNEAVLEEWIFYQENP